MKLLTALLATEVLNELTGNDGGRLVRVTLDVSGSPLFDGHTITVEAMAEAMREHESGADVSTFTVDVLPLDVGAAATTVSIEPADDRVHAFFTDRLPDLAHITAHDGPGEARS